MNRRLNPELFNSHSASADVESPSYSAVATRKMEKELKETRKQVSHLESLLEVTQSQLRVVNENSDKRANVFSKAISDLEHEFREGELRQNRKMQYLESRLKDQQVVEGQVESMVERFNMSLVQFENKLATLQKVLSEKEMTLMTYRNIIEQIVDEVEKLKAHQSEAAYRQRNLPNMTKNFN